MRQTGEMRNTSIFAGSVAIVAATLVTAGAQAAPRSGDAALAEVLKGRVALKPLRCITLSTGDATQIVQGRAIVWRIGRRLYVNVPRARADTLRADDILITEPFGSQLCRNDRVRLLDRNSTIPRGIMLLGNFVPYVRAGNR